MLELKQASDSSDREMAAWLVDGVAEGAGVEETG